MEKGKKVVSKDDITKFAQHMKEFEFHGSQRDLSPELKRIVKNLACKEHDYIYCTCCKKYDKLDFDSLDKI
jgi:hypothetical protein